eukprot:GHVU01097308.1.p3 GENE.GHVU01097308.1~~GHVU01097308.1.p3  ORF type:complete len:104 (+),score=7.48 GHVU01097308.1:596-907(+)
MKDRPRCDEQVSVRAGRGTTHVRTDWIPTNGRAHTRERSKNEQINGETKRQESDERKLGKEIRKGAPKSDGDVAALVYILYANARVYDCYRELISDSRIVPGK